MPDDPKQMLPSSFDPNASDGGASPQQTRPSAVAPPLTATSTKTTPIADAVRGEIKQILDSEVLDLKLFADLVEVARTGRDLVAVRNPTARFDAKAQGLEGMGSPGGMGGIGVPSYPNYFECDDDDMDDCSPQWKGQGPGVRGASRRMEEDIRKMLRDSPLAKAAKTEILALTDANPFAASELIQIEQLAAHTLRLLAARLGISAPSRGGRRGRMGGMVSMNYGMNSGYGGMYPAQSPYSSPETYGAKMGRELVDALAPKKEEADPEKLVLAIAQARTSGLPDLAAKLEAQLTGSPPPPPAGAPAPAPAPALAPVASATPKGEG